MKKRVQEMTSKSVATTVAPTIFLFSSELLSLKHEPLEIKKLPSI